MKTPRYFPSLVSAVARRANAQARLLFLCLIACCVAAACRAQVVYKFTYTAVSGPVNSFSLSFTVPAFVTAGSTPAFTPFTLTDGTNSWTMKKDLVTVEDPTGLNRACFQFGTPFAGLSLGMPPLFGPCSLSVGGPGVNQAAFEFETTGLPTAAGTYPAVAFVGSFDTPTGFESITSQFNPTGTMSLTISLSSAGEKERLSTKLTGFDETPSILTNGTGTFTATFDPGATSLSFSLTYSGLSSNVTQGHIHFAEPGVPGSIIVFLCSGPKPACPAAGGTVTGTVTGADVLAVSSQGVTAGSFSDLLRILRSGDAYVNVHTANHPAGEIRGQLAMADE